MNRFTVSKSERYDHMWNIRDERNRTKEDKGRVLAYFLTESMANVTAQMYEKALTEVEEWQMVADVLEAVRLKIG